MHPHIRPQYFFTIDIKLRRGGQVRFEQVGATASDYDNILGIASHHCRFLLKEGYSIVQIRLTNFRFGPHNYFNYYGDDNEY